MTTIGSQIMNGHALRFHVWRYCTKHNSGQQAVTLELQAWKRERPSSVPVGAVRFIISVLLRQHACAYSRSVRSVCSSTFEQLCAKKNPFHCLDSHLLALRPQKRSSTELKLLVFFGRRVFEIQTLSFQGTPGIWPKTSWLVSGHGYFQGKKDCFNFLPCAKNHGEIPPVCVWTQAIHNQTVEFNYVLAQVFFVSLHTDQSDMGKIQLVSVIVKSELTALASKSAVGQIGGSNGNITARSAAVVWLLVPLIGSVHSSPSGAFCCAIDLWEMTGAMNRWMNTQPNVSHCNGARGERRQLNATDWVRGFPVHMELHLALACMYLRPTLWSLAERNTGAASVALNLKPLNYLRALGVCFPWQTFLSMFVSCGLKMHPKVTTDDVDSAVHNSWRVLMPQYRQDNRRSISSRNPGPHLAYLAAVQTKWFSGSAGLFTEFLRQRVQDRALFHRSCRPHKDYFRWPPNWWKTFVKAGNVRKHEVGAMPKMQWDSRREHFWSWKLKSHWDQDKKVVRACVWTQLM